MRAARNLNVFVHGCVIGLYTSVGVLVVSYGIAYLTCASLTSCAGSLPF